MQTEAQQLIADNDYLQYEVSAYARSNKQCVHNRNYWEFGDYLGIGAGAHSKLTDVNQQTIVRLIKEKHPREYISKALRAEATISEQALNRKDLAIEFMMNALRLSNGFSTSLYVERTGLPIATVKGVLHEAERLEFIVWDLNSVTPTEKGRLFLNDLLQLFLSDNN